MRKLVAILLLIPSFHAIAAANTGDSNLIGWNEAIIQKANTAADVSYMTENEKKVVEYINLSRMQPQLFASTLLKNYLKGYPALESNDYVLSLQSDLESATSLESFLPDTELYWCAEKWADFIGTNGMGGHGDFQVRVQNFLDENKRVGEDIDYGFNDPLTIVMRLLIDNGVEGVGHRKAILNNDYTNIGLSIKPHINFTWACVIDFDGKM